MNKKKRLLFFIQNGVGGAERMTINIAKLLPTSDWDITICKVSMPFIVQNGRIDDFIPKEFKLTNIYWSGQISFIRQLWKIIRKFNPHIVFSSVMPYNQRLLLISPFFKKIKFIVRNDNYLFTINRLKRFSLKQTYKRASAIIAQTEEMKEELCLLGLNPRKIIVLHNLIDKELISTKASEPSPFPQNNKARFVSVGRLAPQKGFDILIKAFEQVVEHIPDSELYIIGSYDGEGQKVYRELNALTAQLNIKDKVHFTGYTENPYKYMKNASVYVLSSRYEGLPNVLVEAQFLKTPAAAVKCIPMISRMIKDGVNGFLAKPEDPDSLAEAMINAVGMKDVNFVYKSSTKEDFIQVFSNVNEL